MGWVKAVTRRFQFDDAARYCRFRIWDGVCEQVRDDQMFWVRRIHQILFVHSYHFEIQDENIALIDSHMVIPSPQPLARQRNWRSISPEKSHRHGMNLMKNFCTMQRMLPE